jgi:hypothetical protein
MKFQLLLLMSIGLISSNSFADSHDQLVKAKSDELYGKLTELRIERGEAKIKKFIKQQGFDIKSIEMSDSREFRGSALDNSLAGNFIVVNEGTEAPVRVGSWVAIGEYITKRYYEETVQPMTTDHLGNVLQEQIKQLIPRTSIRYSLSAAANNLGCATNLNTGESVVCPRIHDKKKYGTDTRNVECYVYALVEGMEVVEEKLKCNW